MPGRRFIVRRADAGRTVADWLRRRLGLPREAVSRLVRQGRVRIGGSPCPNPHRRLAAGQRVGVDLGDAARAPKRSHPRQPRRADGGSVPVVRYADEHVVVVDKPAGLTTMRHPEEAAEFGARARRFLPPTLADRLPALLAGSGAGGRPVIAVHRLDKDTSGLVVLARTPQAARQLGQQFRAHSVDRLYLGVVRGRARPARIESWLVGDRGDGRRGSAPQAGGQHAVTHVRVVEELGDYTLVECRLETGRTHQVRIHLGEAGTPLCGERVYDRPVHGRPLPDGSGAGRVALHAAVLGFEHPATGKRMRWTAPLPADMAGLVQRLRKGKEDQPPRRQGRQGKKEKEKDSKG
jgi:23S rRNA pseudouridine1911/1915/1917 synthase